MVDKAVRAVNTTITQSSVHYHRFHHLQEYVCQANLEMQGIHAVRWLSRGEAVKRFVKVLPATILLLHENSHAVYEVVTSFKFHFLVFFLADLLAILNDLNIKFQKQQVDITVVASEVSLACRTIEVRYIECEDSFGNGQSPMLSDFLKKQANRQQHEVTVDGVDKEGKPATHKFVLHERKLDGVETGGDYYACKKLCQDYARETRDRLEYRFADLENLNGAKIYRPAMYPEDTTLRMRRCREWLAQLDKLFHYCLPAKL
ncbi:unnamed protein product [Closterium sp. Naga37s-1]|nr:unnamed protein product [Closterium sp. Naga37s-1]